MPNCPRCKQDCSQRIPDFISTCPICHVFGFKPVRCHKCSITFCEMCVRYGYVK